MFVPTLQRGNAARTLQRPVVRLPKPTMTKKGTVPFSFRRPLFRLWLSAIPEAEASKRCSHAGASEQSAEHRLRMLFRPAPLLDKKAAIPFSKAKRGLSPFESLFSLVRLFPLTFSIQENLDRSHAPAWECGTDAPASSRQASQTANDKKRGRSLFHSGVPCSGQPPLLDKKAAVPFSPSPFTCQSPGQRAGWIAHGKENCSVTPQSCQKQGTQPLLQDESLLYPWIVPPQPLPENRQPLYFALSGLRCRCCWSFACQPTTMAAG